MSQWKLYEDGHHYDTIEADSAEEALEIALGNVERSNYNDVDETLFVDVEVKRVSMTDEEIEACTHSLTVHDAAPDDAAPVEYRTSIDHGGHGEACEDCSRCDEELAELRASLPEGWCAEWTGDGNGTCCDVSIMLSPHATLESASDNVVLQPEEPECSSSDGRHVWQSPLFLGGLDENPGVWGHGGGVMITEVCMTCGCGRHTDTWAINPCNGTQGHRTVSYEPGEFSDEIEVCS